MRTTALVVIAVFAFASTVMVLFLSYEVLSMRCCHSVEENRLLSSSSFVAYVVIVACLCLLWPGISFKSGTKYCKQVRMTQTNPIWRETSIRAAYKCEHNHFR